MQKFKCILQNDETDCGPACLAAIFRKYGLKVTIAKIRDIAGTDRQGTSAYGLVKAIEHYGFQQKVYMLLSIINEVNLTQCILISLLIRMN